MYSKEHILVAGGRGWQAGGWAWAGKLGVAGRQTDKHACGHQGHACAHQGRHGPEEEMRADINDMRVDLNDN